MLRIYIVSFIILGLTGCHYIGTFEDMKTSYRNVNEARNKYEKEEKKENLESKKKTLTTQEIMATWEGSHISKLIKVWGPADKTSPDGLGGTIYSFIKTYKSQTYTEEHDPRPKVLVGDPRNRRVRTPVQGEVDKVTRTYGGQITEIRQMFFANQEGVIYHTLIK
tara:strand:+ start:162 stop:656 length:495 start_codon:yes stop_codon:yes gene_type:complete